MTDYAGFEDDPTILAEDQLLRRLRPGQLVHDGNLGRDRPSSISMSNDQEGLVMSIYLEKELPSKGLTTGDVVSGHPGYGIAALKADFCRKEEQRVARDPVSNSPRPHPCDPAHGVVAGTKKESRQRHLARSALVLLEPARYQQSR